MRREDSEAHPKLPPPPFDDRPRPILCGGLVDSPHRASENRKRRGTVGSLFERPLAHEPFIGHDGVFPLGDLVPERDPGFAAHASGLRG